jgi:hypothetical protein
VTAPERLLKPPTRVPFINDRTGQMAREWELYFLNLLGRTDYVQGVTVTHTADLTQVNADIDALQLEDIAIKAREDALEMLPVQQPFESVGIDVSPAIPDLSVLRADIDGLMCAPPPQPSSAQTGQSITASQIQSLISIRI